MDIVEKIGLPATLEQLAEECVELAQAALKYARMLRGENPTPKSEEQLRNSLMEELADVEVCSTILPDSIMDEARFEAYYRDKLDRWRHRLGINRVADKIQK